MKPGKELDELVAESIFGWKKIPLTPTFPYELDWMWDKKEGCLRFEAQECPNYSTDIRQAWKVVDKLEEIMCELEFSFGKNKKIWATFVVSGEVDGSHPIFQSEGRTAAHAICLAGLKAIEYFNIWNYM